MGAWDATAFGNDDAADWADALMDSANPVKLLQDTFAKAGAGVYLEAPDASEIVAAAAVVAASRSRRSLRDDLDNWLQQRRQDFLGLSAVATAALNSVRSQSELNDLWQEGDSYQAWSEHLDQIVNELR